MVNTMTLTIGRRRMISGCRDLVVWQRGMDLAVLCYRVTESFPQSERFGLTLQLRKSAGSVPANIAEGRGRRSTAEFIRFLNISYGSLTELETHVLRASRLGFCTMDEAESVIVHSAEVGRMLNGLIGSLRLRTRKPACRKPLNPES
jgi:four helix bundle protein